MVGNKRARISVYDTPPEGAVTLEEFEQFALDRMRVLKVWSMNCIRFTIVSNKSCSIARPSIQLKPKVSNKMSFHK
jgi:hypothetical protein